MSDLAYQGYRFQVRVIDCGTITEVIGQVGAPPETQPDTPVETLVYLFDGVDCQTV